MIVIPTEAKRSGGIPSRFLKASASGSLGPSRIGIALTAACASVSPKGREWERRPLRSKPWPESGPFSQWEKARMRVSERFLSFTCGSN
jgi:hypothetical protein